MGIREGLREKLLVFQRNEVTEHVFYRRLARSARGRNAEVLKRLAADELRHYRLLARYTGQEVGPRRLWLLFYLAAARVFGLTFAIKLMEARERRAEAGYAGVVTEIPELKELMADEEEHEQALVALIDEERLGYLSSMVLGLNDALVELTGALAGLTLALGTTRLVGLAGLVTGIAASLSMAASEYLSTKSESGAKSPLKAAFYTGIAYVATVSLLIFPFFLLGNALIALGTALGIGVAVVALFTFFMAVVRDLGYQRTFLEMVAISLGVAGISFLIGWLLRETLGVET